MQKKYHRPARAPPPKPPRKVVNGLKVLNDLTPYSDFFVTFASLITHYSIIP